ncbi:MAG: electron transfer flavoprotein subunit beta/FixA family protein [Saprospiraceae bacterium]
MKILVCISATPDTTSKISFKNNDREFNTDNIQFILNPYDEWYALVKALELKEKLGGTVTVIHVGPAQNEPMIRKALAIGADDAVRINDIPFSSYETAHQIAHYAETQQYDLILLGKETIDYQSGEVGSMIAELLSLPYVAFSSQLDIIDGLATCSRDIEGGVEILEIKLPVVISASKGMAEQRIANMKGIMMAKSKTLLIIEPIEVVSNASIMTYSLRPSKKGVKMIEADHMDELVRMLHEHDKVI